MKFLIFDREENYIGALKDVLEAKQTEEINGEDVLELSVLEQKIENISDEWGRNLILRDSLSIKGSTTIHSTDGYHYDFTAHTETSGLSTAPSILERNLIYTLSYEVKHISGELVNWGGHNRHTQIGYFIDGISTNSSYHKGYSGFPTDGEFHKVVLIFKADRIDVVGGEVLGLEPNRYNPNLPVRMEIKNVKLEKGSTATPWTPAPEDLDIKPQDTIEKGHKIVYKDKYGFWKEFIVKELEESHTNDGIEKRLFCESSFYETFGDYIEDKRPSGTASHALSVALEPTRWEVGTVDNLGTNATNFYQISAKEAVQKVAETWKGEIRTRVEVVGNKIVHRYVDILERRGGDYGRRFTYTKNLESVTKTIHREDVITALYGYGKGEEVGEGYGRRIDFADINDGKAYVEDTEAKEVWGRPNPDGTKKHVFDKVYFDDCEDKQELLQLTTEKLEEVSSPLITYEAKAIDLGGAGLGDSVAVIDTEFTPELRLKARVIKIVRDLLKEENNALVLGNFIPSIVDNWNKQEEFINNFRSKQGVWDRADIINDDGTINAQFLNNLVDELNKKMNSQGGYVYVSEDGKGLTTYDKPIDQDPTMAIQLLGGAFRIANNKLPNGEWDWRTFGTGAGFTADEFVAGVLRGGKVHFDLTNGTFLIGNSPEDYIFYFDGTTLKVRLGTGKTIEESLQEIQEEVENLEIGTRNLFSLQNVESYTPWNTSPTVEGTTITTTIVRADTGFNFTIRDHLQQYRNVDQVYTASGFIKKNGEIDSSFFTRGTIHNQTETLSLTVDATTGYFVTTFRPQAGMNTYLFHIRVNAVPGDVIEIDKLMVEKGNKATDWTPAPEDVDEAIQNAQGTADQANSKADGLQDDLIEYIDTTATAEELGELITSMNDYMAMLDTANAEVENVKLEIADLLERVPAIELELGDFIQSWRFMDTFIRMGEEGLLIQEINGQTGIRITTDRIDFLDGAGEPVAYITNQIMRINRGIFVESAQIGEHKIETIGDGHTVFTWMGEE